jgi:hypothetical protein
VKYKGKVMVGNNKEKNRMREIYRCRIRRIEKKTVCITPNHLRKPAIAPKQ